MPGTAALGLRPSPRSWTLTLLLGGVGTACGLAAALPYHDDVPVGLLRSVATVALLLALVAHLTGNRPGRCANHLLLAAVTGLLGLVAAGSATPEGALLVSYGYFPVAAYAACSFPRRAALAHGAGISASFGVALLASGGIGPVAWLTVTVTVGATMVVLGTLVGRLSEQATTDQLTGLLNRHGIAGEAERLLALADRANMAVSVVVIDLDDFKQVNDRHGHAAGDRLLHEFAASLQAQLRVSDIVGRLGGDEFVTLLPDTTAEDAEAVVARLRPAYSLAWSAGVTQRSPGEDLDTCLERADRALYRAKAAAPGSSEAAGPAASPGPCTPGAGEPGRPGVRTS